MAPTALPKLEHYQKRTVEGAATAVIKRGEDVLVESPTGSGKTAMLARIARQVARHDGKVLILTHRRQLFRQMTGRPDGETQKERLGEIRYWSGIRPGTIAEDALGGIDQDPAVVVAMVETACNRLDQLAQYSAIIVDEVQHLSEDSAEREDTGSYARIIEINPEARLVGMTATTFRGDGDNLHPRLETAHREVVSVEEARASGRIVPARTVIGKAPLESGRTVADWVARERDGKLGKKSAATMIAEDRGEAFYEHVVEDWSRIVQSKKTILFVDSLAEIEKMEKLFSERYGAGIAVSIHGRKSDRDNDQAVRDYASGGAGVLIACQMIGEGFDVPETDAVMSINTSLSRLEMNQYVGRAVRAALGKTEGLFLDYGTASHVYGTIEHQHQLQNIDAMAASGSAIAAARAIGRMAPARNGDWMVVPGGDRSLFIQAKGGGYAVYERSHKAERELNRRAGKNNGSMGKLTGLEHPDHGQKLLPPRALASLLAAHARDEVEWIGSLGGIGSEAYAARCALELETETANLEVMMRYQANALASRGRPARAEALDGMLASPEGTRHRARMLRRALEGAGRGEDMVREGLLLTGAMLVHCSKRDELPLGLRAEARSVTESLARSDVDKLTAARLRKEAEAAISTMTHIGGLIGDSGLASLLSDISDPMKSGLERMDSERRRNRQTAKA